MKSSLLIGLSLCAVACAHREPRQHTTVSAVGNEDVTENPSDPDNKKMQYTEVNNEDALNQDRERQEHEAMNGHLNREDVPAAALLDNSGAQRTSTGERASAAGPEKCGLNVYFATASAELTPQAKQQLEAVASCLKREHSAEDALIVGSADPRGTEPENAQLGEERAKRVAKYLRQLGVPDGEIRIRTLGESQASAAPDTYPSSRKAQVKAQ
ncbi:MAG TPA: OmpA family protein [Polyangiales bacterium]